MSSLSHQRAQWCNQVPQYQKAITKCEQLLCSSISFIVPPNHSEKEQQLKNLLAEGRYQFDAAQYTDIYLYYIEGKINLTLMEVASKIQQQLGGSIRFWLNRILDVAQNEVYSPQLTIWHALSHQEKYLYIPPDTLQELKKFRRLARLYLSALKSLIKDVTKLSQSSHPLSDSHPTHTDSNTLPKYPPLETTDSTYDENGSQELFAKIDQSFSRYKQNQQKYLAYLEAHRIVQVRDAQQIRVIPQNSNDQYPMGRERTVQGQGTANGIDSIKQPIALNKQSRNKSSKNLSSKSISISSGMTSQNSAVEGLPTIYDYVSIRSNMGCYSTMPIQVSAGQLVSNRIERPKLTVDNGYSALEEWIGSMREIGKSRAQQFNDQGIQSGSSEAQTSSNEAQTASDEPPSQNNKQATIKSEHQVYSCEQLKDGRANMVQIGSLRHQLISHLLISSSNSSNQRYKAFQCRSEIYEGHMDYYCNISNQIYYFDMIDLPIKVSKDGQYGIAGYTNSNNNGSYNSVQNQCDHTASRPLHFRSEKLSLVRPFDLLTQINYQIESDVQYEQYQAEDLQLMGSFASKMESSEDSDYDQEIIDSDFKYEGPPIAERGRFKWLIDRQGFVRRQAMADNQGSVDKLRGALQAKDGVWLIGNTNLSKESWNGLPLAMRLVKESDELSDSVSDQSSNSSSNSSYVNRQNVQIGCNSQLNGPTNHLGSIEINGNVSDSCHNAYYEQQFTESMLPLPLTPYCPYTELFLSLNIANRTPRQIKDTLNSMLAKGYINLKRKKVKNVNRQYSNSNSIAQTQQQFPLELLDELLNTYCLKDSKNKYTLKDNVFLIKSQFRPKQDFDVVNAADKSVSKETSTVCSGGVASQHNESVQKQQYDNQCHTNNDDFQSTVQIVQISDHLQIERISNTQQQGLLSSEKQRPQQTDTDNNYIPQREQKHYEI